MRKARPRIMKGPAPEKGAEPRSFRLWAMEIRAEIQEHKREHKSGGSPGSSPLLGQSSGGKAPLSLGAGLWNAARNPRGRCKGWGYLTVLQSAPAHSLFSTPPTIPDQEIWEGWVTTRSHNSEPATPHTLPDPQKRVTQKWLFNHISVLTPLTLSCPLPERAGWGGGGGQYAHTSSYSPARPSNP